MSYDLRKDHKKRKKRSFNKYNPSIKGGLIQDKENKKNNALSDFVIISNKIDIIPNLQLHNEIEALKSFIPCSADSNCLIDRYDGRALLDNIPKKLSTKSPKTIHSKEENLLNYERYNSIIEFFKQNISEKEAIKIVQDAILDTTMAPTQIEQDEILENERYMEELSKNKQPSQPLLKFAPVITEDVIVVKDETENQDKDEEIDENINVEIKPESNEKSSEEIDNYALKFGIIGYCKIMNRENNKLLEQHYYTKEESKSKNRLEKIKTIDEVDLDHENTFNFITDSIDNEIIKETYKDHLSNENMNEIYEKSLKFKAFLKENEQKTRKLTKMDQIQMNIRKNLDDIINDDLKKHQKSKEVKDNDKYDSFGRIKKELKKEQEAINKEQSISNDKEQKRKRKRSKSPKRHKKSKHDKNNDFKKLSKIEKMLKELEK